MNTFEYISIAYSLLFSATALRLIGGLPHAFSKARRYWVHAAAVVLLLFGIVLNFWSVLQFREVDWNLFRFVVLLAIPGILYFIACSAIPDNPAEIESWENLYYAKRKQLYSGVLAWGLALGLNNSILLDLSLFHPVRVVQLGLVILGASGLASARPSVHRTLIFVATAVAALSAVIILFFRNADAL